MPGFEMPSFEVPKVGFDEWPWVGCCTPANCNNVLAHTVRRQISHVACLGREEIGTRENSMQAVHAVHCIEQKVASRVCVSRSVKRV
jgi:hypothetical protein